MRGGAAELTQVSPRSWARAGACTSLLPGCSATTPVGRTELCCPWAALGSGHCGCHRLQSQNCCLQHQQALGKCTSAEDSELCIPACPLLAGAAAGHRAGSNWDPASAPWGPGTAAWARHLQPSPAPAFCVVSAEILHLRVFSGAWGHFNHHKTTTWRWFTSPLSCPVHEGP